VGSLTFQKLKRFNGAKSAPIGHNALQKARLLKTTSRRTATNMLSFTTDAKGKTRDPLEIMLGRVTCSAEAGQILQKEYMVSSPRKKGMRKTIKTSTRYLILPVQ
jgi:hypothetical protein